MIRSWRQVLGGLVLLLSAMCGPARADTPIALFKSFAGYVNFTGTAATMRTGTANVCQVVASTTTISKALAGIPSGATVLSAHLYWAGSGTTPDTTVTFEGQTITAQRNYTASYTTGGTTYDYFSAAADVTSIVKAKGNGTYSFSGLTVSTGTPWCTVEGVLGGFALLVVYEDAPSQPFRVLNLYEGFQYTRNSSLTLNLSNFRVPNPIGSATGRIGHITWEGDDTLSAAGEDLTFNGYEMTDSLNPSGNQFNSKSNINGDSASYGIDFDAYTVASPKIVADQTTANTVYASGQDLVLLNAEIVAVPNVPTDDLSLTMSRSGQTIPGQNVTYTLQVGNNGPNDELGPITVVDTLPTGMAFVSATGTGWVCSASGQVVTCTRSGALANGATASAITLKVAVSYTATGTYTNSATVSGQIFDNVSDNNTDTDTATDPTILQGAGMILTDRACTSGVAVSTNLSDSGCHRITWLYANSVTNVYLTVLDSSGIPKAPKTNGTYQYSPTFSLSCVNPTTAGTTSTATFAGKTLRTCLSNGATPSSTATNTWSSAASLPFTSGAASVGPVSFQYPDVGLLQLNFNDATTSTTIRTARFISVPTQLSITVTRPDGAANPGPNSGNTLGFVRAGEAFTVSVKALMSGTSTPAPSFGRETPAVGLKLAQSATPKAVGTFASQGNGIISGNFTYNEVGDVTFTALMSGPLNDYLGSGVAVGYDPNASPAQSPPSGQSVLVGRFYPAYFSTDSSYNFACLARMKCASGSLAHGELLTVSGATHAGQPFTVTVTPRAVDGTALKNYGGVYGAQITLKAVSQPAGSTSGSGTLYLASNDSTTVTIPALSQAQVLSGTPLTASTYFKLLVPYSASSPHPNPTWSSPTPVYFNAVAQQSRVTAGGAVGSDPISSNRTTAAISYEGGVEVINGRLQVGNAYGSELLRLPVQIAAQYWTGSAWEINTGDSASTVDATKTIFVSCSGITCSSAALLSGSVKLVTGVNTIWFKAPGVGGNAVVQMGALGLPSYLPSTQGKIVFGVYKSKLIYFREVY
jgi:MSHA biogenesis protein MshQ